MMCLFQVYIVENEDQNRAAGEKVRINPLVIKMRQHEAKARKSIIIIIIMSYA